MPLDPELIALRHRLQEVGMVVVEEPHHLTVRLPYFCSVRIRLVDGCLRFDPFFGLVPRTRSTMLKLFLFISFTVAAFKAGVPFALGVAIVGIMLGIYDIIRTIATESVITRAGIVYTQLVHDERPTFGASAAAMALEAGSMPLPTPPGSPRAERQTNRNQVR